MSTSARDLTVREIRSIASQRAAEVLAEFWDEGTFPIDPIKVANRMGVEVFDAQLGTDVFGMLVGSKAGADIYLDREQPPKRYRFTCAHELGHYVDHADEEPRSTYIDKRSDDNRGSSEEVFANEFAGNLLMPEREVRLQHNLGQSLYALADHFEVSTAALSYRGTVLGLRFR